MELALATDSQQEVRHLLSGEAAEATALREAEAAEFAALLRTAVLAAAVPPKEMIA